MDNAVALVEAYLHVNGYFAVTEYPVIDAVGCGKYCMVTDLDILAFRFPEAGRLVVGEHADKKFFWPDPRLKCPSDKADMLVGEVKEGRAELNRAARNPAVLKAMLARFGCCPMDDAGHVLNKGRIVTPGGYVIRLIDFGTVFPSEAPQGYQVVSLSHVVEFLQGYLRQHWPILCHAQFKHPGFGFLAALDKALHINEHDSVAG